MKWQDFFRVTYHPDPGWWIVHWQSTYRPVNSLCFKCRENADKWLDNNWRSIIDEEFEKILMFNE